MKKVEVLISGEPTPLAERVLIVTHHRRKVLTVTVCKPTSGFVDVQIVTALASDYIADAGRSVIGPSL